MAILISSSNGNFSANVWSPCSNAGTSNTGSVSDSEAGQFALTTNVTTAFAQSAAFVLETATYDGVAFKLASRAAGTAANILTVVLFDANAATNVFAQTLNVSELDDNPSGAIDGLGGGWYFLKTASTFTAAGNTYTLRCVLNSTNTAVSLYVSGGNNFSRLFRKNANAAAGSGDTLHIMGEYSNATAVLARLITMDSTTNTQYGATPNNTAGNTVSINSAPSLTISKGGTLQWNVSVNTVLQVSGWIGVYSNGVMQVGNVATPIPTGTTATIKFNQLADSNGGMVIRRGGTLQVQGAARTSGKNVVSTLLTANIATTQNTVTVADDTGWLSGDAIWLAPTTRTRTEAEQVSLTTDANSSTLSFTANVASAHAGNSTNLIQGEAINVTRNITFVSGNTTVASRGYLVNIIEPANCDLDWCSFQNLGTTSGLFTQLTSNAPNTGAITMSYVSLRDSQRGVTYTGPTGTATQTVSFDNLVSANGVGTWANIASIGTTHNAVCNWSNCTFILTSSGPGFVVSGFDPKWNIGNIRCAGIAGSGIDWSVASVNNYNGNTVGQLVAHSGAGAGITFPAVLGNIKFDNLLSWRNSGIGISFGGTGPFSDIEFTKIICIGNTNDNMNMGAAANYERILMRDLRLYSDSGFTTANGIVLSNGTATRHKIFVANCDFGTAVVSPYTAHTNDLTHRYSGAGLGQWTFNNGLFTAATLINGTISNAVGTFYKFGNFQRATSGANTHKAIAATGNLTFEVTTVDVSPSLKMTPSNTTYKLMSHLGIRGAGFLAAVSANDIPTLSVKVNIGNTYNGNAPRLIIHQNSALGMANDAIATANLLVNATFQTLSITLGTMPADGVLEAYVDCDGTVGTVVVDTADAS